MEALRAFIYCHLFESYRLQNREIIYLLLWIMPLHPVGEELPHKSNNQFKTVL